MRGGLIIRYYSKLHSFKTMNVAAYFESSVDALPMHFLAQS